MNELLTVDVLFIKERDPMLYCEMRYIAKTNTRKFKKRDGVNFVCEFSSFAPSDRNGQ